MMPADAEADLSIDFKPSTWCQEAETWWSERVGWREDDAAVVDTGGERGVRGPADCEVPVEEVCVRGGTCLVVRAGGIGEFGGFADCVV
jgi:hypothetical protein